MLTIALLEAAKRGNFVTVAYYPLGDKAGDGIPNDSYVVTSRMAGGANWSRKHVDAGYIRRLFATGGAQAVEQCFCNLLEQVTC
jgi:hypothetical protein